MTRPQVSAQQDGHGQDAGGGGNHGVSQVQGQNGHGSHQAHGLVLTLGDDGAQGADQNHGHITENGDGHDVGSHTGGQLQVLAAEQLDEEVDHGLGGAGVTDGAGDDRTKDDGHTDAAQSGTEAVGNGGDGRQRAVAQNGAAQHAADKQGDDGVDVQLDDEEHQHRNGDDDRQNELRHDCSTS